MNLLAQKMMEALQQGGIVAYPCEGVFGLGCDPFSREAVEKLNKIKQRPLNKGFILIVANWDQVAPYVDIDLSGYDKKLNESEHTTWVMPANSKAPAWITYHGRLACRIIKHPDIWPVCQAFGPIVSTSANKRGQLPARDAKTVEMLFAKALDFVFPSEVGSYGAASKIIDIQTQKVLRS
jgi:L-threonylcarbamoyladenylate synthase